MSEKSGGKKPAIKLRGWASALLAGAFLGLAVTGGIAWANPWSEPVAALHTIFALAFGIALMLHMRGNFATLGSYFRRRPVALGLALGLGGLFILLSGALGLPPLYGVFDTGVALRGQADVRSGEWTLVEVGSGKDSALDISLTLAAGPHYVSQEVELPGGFTIRTVPQAVVWLEDMEGNFLETLYATGKVATGAFQRTDFWNEAPRRPESLPVWSHARGKSYADGLYVPTTDAPLPDGITAATPWGSYEVRAGHTDRSRPLRVRLEINRSFDYNEHWHPQRFPEDPVYTGGGNSGQPSLVYEAIYDPAQGAPRTLLMRPVGHGHHSGQDGRIYPDLSGFDSALQLLDWALVRFR